MTVVCDNGDCCYIGEDGFCGCDKLNIVGGVCAGSYRSGRNACDGDVDVQLKAEKAKLREYITRLEQANIVLSSDNYDLRNDMEDMQLFIADNRKLRELVSQMYRDMQGVLDMSIDTVFVDSIGTLRDMMDRHMQAMAELGMPPADYEKRMRELGMEATDGTVRTYPRPRRRWYDGAHQ